MMIRSRLSSAWGLLTGKLNALTIRWLQGAPPGPTNSQVQAAAARAFLLQEYGVLRFDPVSCIDHVPGDPHFESLKENLETLMDFASPLRDHRDPRLVHRLEILKWGDEWWRPENAGPNERQRLAACARDWMLSEFSSLRFDPTKYFHGPPTNDAWLQEFFHLLMAIMDVASPVGDPRDLLLVHRQEIAKWGDGWWRTHKERQELAEHNLKSCRSTALSVYYALALLHNSIPLLFYVAGWTIVVFLWLRLCFYGLRYRLDFGQERHLTMTGTTNHAVKVFGPLSTYVCASFWILLVLFLEETFDRA